MFVIMVYDAGERRNSKVLKVGRSTFIGFKILYLRVS